MSKNARTHVNVVLPSDRPFHYPTECLNDLICSCTEHNIFGRNLGIIYSLFMLAVSELIILI